MDEFSSARHHDQQRDWGADKTLDDHLDKARKLLFQIDTNDDIQELTRT